MTMPDPSERRQHQRQIVSRLCKVRDRKTAMYSPGQTSDISLGGAMIEVNRTRPFGPGDELDVVVAWANGAILSSESMVKATVKRVIPLDDTRQALAVQFAESAAQSIAA